MYYLRARYYDPLNGRFNQFDPYAGNNEDPQSLHKYTYCHNNPVNMSDPSGMFGDMSFGGILAATSIQGMMYGIILGASLNAFSGGMIAVGFGKFFSYLLKGDTWCTAAKGVFEAIKELFENPVSLLVTVLLGLLSKVFAIISIAQIAWDIINASSALIELSKNGFTLDDIAWFAAITTATMVICFAISATIGRAAKESPRRIWKPGGKPGSAELEKILNDPALQNVDLTFKPIYDPDLEVFGRKMGKPGRIVLIGPKSFVSRREVIDTIIHEEVHVRLDYRNTGNSMRAKSKTCNRFCEDNYCRRIAERFTQMKGIED